MTTTLVAAVPSTASPRVRPPRHGRAAAALLLAAALAGAGLVSPGWQDGIASELSSLATASTEMEASLTEWIRTHLGALPESTGYGLLLAGLGVMEALTRKRRSHGG